MGKLSGALTLIKPVSSNCVLQIHALASNRKDIIILKCP
jgi:hypothetical protein